MGLSSFFAFKEYSGAELSFWVHARGSSMGKLSVGISNSPNGPFTNVYTQFGETHLAGNSPWSQIGVDLSSYLGQSLYASFTYTRLPHTDNSWIKDILEKNFLLVLSGLTFGIKKDGMGGPRLKTLDQPTDILDRS